MPTKQEYQKLQQEMGTYLEVPDSGVGYQLKTGDTIVTLDVQYKGEDGYVALDIQVWEEEGTGLFLAKIPVEFPYEPGYFAFREGPVLLGALDQWREETGKNADLLVIDGHGTAHPRKMGLACWMGIKSQVPSIGVAKEPLLKMPYNLDEEVGATCPVEWEGELVGTVVRTSTGVKPVYVSPGHRVSQTEAVKIALALRGKYRIIEPIRRADQAARKFAKGELKQLTS